MNGTEYIKKNLRKVRIYYICLALFFVLVVGAAFLLPRAWGDLYNYLILALCASSCAFFICLVLYLTYGRPFLRCYKRLQKKGLEYIADDIDLERTPEIPYAKIFCGKKALISKKSRVIIPYADIALAYVYNVNNFETAGGFYTKDGSKFTLVITPDEFTVLMEEYVKKASPDVLIGRNPEEKKRYQGAAEIYEIKKKAREEAAMYDDSDDDDLDDDDLYDDLDFDLGPDREKTSLLKRIFGVVLGLVMFIGVPFLGYLLWFFVNELIDMLFK